MPDRIKNFGSEICRSRSTPYWISKKIYGHDLANSATFRANHFMIRYMSWVYCLWFVWSILMISANSSWKPAQSYRSSLSCHLLLRLLIDLNMISWVWCHLGPAFNVNTPIMRMIIVCWVCIMTVWPKNNMTWLLIYRPL